MKSGFLFPPRGVQGRLRVSLSEGKKKNQSLVVPEFESLCRLIAAITSSTQFTPSTKSLAYEISG
jgi:hypothetical protein